MGAVFRTVISGAANYAEKFLSGSAHCFGRGGVAKCRCARAVFFRGIEFFAQILKGVRRLPNSLISGAILRPGSGLLHIALRTSKGALIE